jgi:hypothetical protein
MTTHTGRVELDRIAPYADELAPVNLQFVVDPAVPTGVEPGRVLASFESTHVGTEVPKHKAPIR